MKNVAIHYIRLAWVVIFVASMITLPSPSVRADGLEQFLEEIQLASNHVNTFSSDFLQEKHLALFTQPIRFKGTLTVDRPNRLRWEFTTPLASTLIFNGDKGMRCSDQGEVNTFSLGSDPVMRAVAEQLWLWLGGDYKKLTDQYLLEKKGGSSLVVTPRDQSVASFIGSVTIVFDPSSRQPQEVKIAEPGGDFTLISFKSYQINGEISDRLFEHCGYDE